MLAALLFAMGPAGIVLPAGDALAQSGGSGKVDRSVAPVAANIDRNGVLILVRGAILALDHANKTGNYTVLRDLGSPAFQRNSAAQLGEIFAQQRDQRLNLGGVAVLEPQLTLMPQIEPNGMLRMAGFFPSVPMQVNFELLYTPVEREWRLYGISVNLAPAGPQAPDTPPEPEPEMSDETPLPPTVSIYPAEAPAR